ncbi:heme-binding protein [Halospeciosus flavus]|uniref:Heme-binding protein n=1 Tax=Halospeciosus flavus TaxID=3032283 RepID=A0ABD5Z7W5_9EURY|nr:heme-binding protein [Halospeciosus flavus]
MVEAPQTAEGWYVLHDFRSVDWDAWRDSPEHERAHALEAGESFLQHREAVADADEGDSAVFSILGHEADLLFLHLRPTLDDLNRIERSFEGTAFAEFTEQTNSYVSVTEVSGYVSDEYFENPEEVDEGLRRYIEGKLEPSLPDDAYVSFYPMSKRRDPEYNWYTLPFEERAELMAEHGDTGRQYGGKVQQIISSSLGLDNWEWGVTLFSEDPVHLKDIVYEMRFDEGSSKYGEFGEFLVGRRFPPSDLDAFLTGEEVPTPESEEREDGHPHGHGESESGSGGHHHGHGESGGEDQESEDGEESLREELADLDVYAGQPHGEDVFAVGLYSEADVDELETEVEGLTESFDHYDTHVETAVYEPVAGEGPAAVVSLWETESAADTAAGFLADLPGVTGRAGEAEEGWGTMGMFYTVEPEYREEFVEKFVEVTDALEGMEGHRETRLLARRDDENELFIDSRWESKEDAMDFFRSDAFRDTVSWGRDVLADRPRHVFLA